MERNHLVQTWKDLKFGLFIHWGIYSLLERGEWVMYTERIPVKEYEKLAARFNPLDFHADEWVETAKNAGMKYLIFTAKHHDGFSMFKTDVDAYNIVDATPFGRDVIAELAEACRNGGIKLGLYYSHVREWRHPMAQSLEVKGYGELLGNYGNYWDYPVENAKDLQQYIDSFDLPQLKELLTNYGDVLTIWFDTPSLIRQEQAEQIRDFIYDLQPQCLINGRLCHELTMDYNTLGDNEIPAVGSNLPWETPMTMSANGAWGYTGDGYFGNAEDMLEVLIDVVSKGGNLLLNVGPDAQGRIPLKAKEQLQKVGNWMDQNGEAIYDSEPSPFLQQPSWGRVTCKKNKIYLFVLNQKPEIYLSGLLSDVQKCYYLADKSALECTRVPEEKAKWIIRCKKTEMLYPVIVLELAGESSVTDILCPGDDGSIFLPVMRGELMRDNPNSLFSVEASGVTKNWLSNNESISWSFEATDPKTYRIELIIKTSFRCVWEFGHILNLQIDDAVVSGKIEDDGQRITPFQERVISFGEITLAAGAHKCNLLPEKIVSDMCLGLTLLSVRLIPVDTGKLLS